MNPVLAARMAKRSGGVHTGIAVEDDRMVISQSQDCTPIMEYAQALHKAGEYGGSEMRHAAKIPNVIIEKYMNEHGVSFQEVMTNPIHFKRICNNPDNKAFRIWPGKV